MHVLEELQIRCFELTRALNETHEDCVHIQNDNISTSVLEYAASTLLANLAYRVSRLLVSDATNFTAFLRR